MEYKQDLPKLASLSYNSTIVDNTHNLVISFTYSNKSRTPFKLKAILPTIAGHAVAGFTVYKDNELYLRSTVKEKEQAQREFDSAVQSGKDAFKVDYSREHDDILMVEVGNLEPGKALRLDVQLFGELAQWAERGGLCTKLDIPTTLFPRYGASVIDGYLTVGHAAAWLGDSEPAAAYDIAVSVDAEFFSQVTGVVGKDRYTEKVIGESGKLALLTKLTSSDVASADLGLLFKTALGAGTVHKRLHVYDPAFDARTLARVEAASVEHEVLLELKMRMPVEPTRQNTGFKEFVFVVDRSGSMSGAFMELAKKALVLALRSLPVGCFFNIISFGSRWEPLRKYMIEYSEATLEETLAEVGAFQADFGGTQLFAPIEYVMNFPLRDAATSRYVYVLTDGGIGDVDSVVAMVAKSPSRPQTVLSALGIGSGASSDLVTRLADAGSGMCDMIQNEQLISSVVIKQLKLHKALRYSAFELSLTTTQGAAHAVPLQAQKSAYFEDDFAALYAALPAAVYEAIAAGAVASAAVRAGQGEGWPLALNKTDITASYAHHKVFYNFWAKDNSLQTSLRYNLLNRATALIAVGEQQAFKEGEPREFRVQQISVRQVHTLKSNFSMKRSMPKKKGKLYKAEEKECFIRSNADYPVISQNQKKSSSIMDYFSLPISMNLFGNSSKKECLEMNECYYEPEIMIKSNAQPEMDRFDLEKLDEKPEMKVKEVIYCETNVKKNIEFSEGVDKEDIFAGKKKSRKQVESTSKQPQDQYQAILSAQKFNGSFDESKLREILRDYVKDVDSQSHESLVAAVLALLEARFGDRQDEWVLIFEKAVEWLKSRNVDFQNEIEKFKIEIK